jgi:hypothetical protein
MNRVIKSFLLGLIAFAVTFNIMLAVINTWVTVGDVGAVVVGIVSVAVGSIVGGAAYEGIK